MSTGTVTLHSWADGAEEDDAKPPMGCNYNARLDPLIEFDHARDAAHGLPPRHGPDASDPSTAPMGGSVNSRVVRRRAEAQRRRGVAARDGGNGDDEDGEGGVW
jgi:hypothetical protein